MLRVVASGRPVLVTPLPMPVRPGGGASLQGMSAEFFPAPADARGWTRSAYKRQDAVGGRNYLADVLCVRA